MSFTHVFQEDRMGCGIACVAMVAGLTYQQVKACLAPDHPKRDFYRNGLDDLVMPQLLLVCGQAGVITYPYNPLTGQRRINWPQLQPGTVYISCVQTPAGAHYVVIQHDGSILDPNRAGTFALSDYQEVHYLIGIYPIFTPSCPKNSFTTPPSTILTPRSGT